MKIFKKNFSPSILIVMLLLSFIFLLSSCDDDDDNNGPEAQSTIKVINGVFNSPEYHIKVNGRVITNEALTFRRSTGYETVPAGNITLSVSEKSSGNDISTARINIAADQPQSVYTVSAAADAKVEIFAITDDFTPPAPRKSKLRFVNVDARSKPLDVYITGQTTPIFSGTAAKGATSFIDIDPSASLSFTITESGSTTPIATLANAAVEEGKFYTLWGQENSRAAPQPSTTLGLFNNR